MRKALLLFIAAILLQSSDSHAARRILNFVGLGQSHITRDQALTGRVMVSCNVYVRNVSPAVRQRITAFTMSAVNAVPNNGGSTMSGNLRNSIGTETTGLQVFRFSSAGNPPAIDAPVAVPAPPGAINIILDPFATGAVASRDTAHFMSMVSFQYKGNHSTGNAVNIGQNMMFHCTGQITVDEVDVPVVTPGSVIASGVMEYVAGSDSNPGIQYGVEKYTNYFNVTNNPAAGPDRTNLTCNSSMMQPVFTSTGCGPSYTDPENLSTGNPCLWDGTFYKTQTPNIGGFGGPVNQHWCGTDATFSNCWSDDVTDSINIGTRCREQGFYGHSPRVCDIDDLPLCAFNPQTGPDPLDFNVNDGLPAWGTGLTPVLSAFPQQMHSVPFLINGGKPF